MNGARFRAVVMSGHKEDAVEVPFDPAAKWGIKTQQIGAVRSGFAARAEINGVAFDTFVVARARKFWLLLPPEVGAKTDVAAGDEIAIVLLPLA